MICKKENFEAITNCILSADVGSMDTVIQKLSKGSQFDLSSESEKKCFDITNNLDHVRQFVQGLRTNRRYMRNEIRSIITAHGAQFLCITFAPMDQNNYISIYRGAEATTAFPHIFKKDEHIKLIRNNATVCAWFFKFMADIFVKHVLGVDSGHEGLFGETEEYYGTVEE